MMGYNDKYCYATLLLLLSLFALATSFQALAQGGHDAPLPNDKQAICDYLKANANGAIIKNAGDDISGADYVPNIDAYGNPVAGADLPSHGLGQQIIPDQFHIPLDIELQNFFDDNDALQSGLDLDANLGELSVDSNSGDITLNGRPIDHDALISYCQ